MRSRQLETMLTEYLQAAAGYLSGEVAGGAEVPFEVDSQRVGRGVRTTPLYCYRALTGPFIAEREAALRRLPGHAEATRALESFAGLERYLASARTDPGGTRGHGRSRAALRLLLEDVFEDQTDFQLRPERLRTAIQRLERATGPGAARVTLLATLHGVTIASPELQLARGLTLAHAGALDGVPRQLLAPAPGAGGGGADGTHAPLLLVHTAEDEDFDAAVQRGQALFADLLRALRLFGDGRVALGSLAWAQLAGGPWTPLALTAGGWSHGMLVVTDEQEDELRAFCNLVSRRTPQGNVLAWALRRYELGCERESAREALSDHLLALRALLEPEGPSSGMLPGRIAALCAPPEERARLSERMLQTLELEREIIAGAAVKPARAEKLALEVANHLRALLSDVICGHLDAELAALADQLLLDDGDGETPAAEEEQAEPALS